MTTMIFLTRIKYMLLNNLYKNFSNMHPMSYALLNEMFCRPEFAVRELR